LGWAEFFGRDDMAELIRGKAASSECEGEPSLRTWRDKT
jgi:hypothetical protein